MIPSKLNTFLVLVFSIFLLTCNNNSSAPDAETTENEVLTLGKVKINFTGAEAAMPHFEKGLLLMHNFEYEDAREAFLKAQEIDSTFAMAYWGEAMTHNHPVVATTSV